MSDEFLRCFAFRTGIPCGYLIFSLFGAFWCFVALVVVIIGFMRRKWVLVILPSLFLIAAATFVVGNVAYENALELNPIISEAELVGRWRTRSSTLTLAGDGTYDLHASHDLIKDFGTTASLGKWQREGTFDVRLVDSSGKRLPVLRAITFRGTPHLIIEFDDPDSWDGDLGFSKVPPV